MKTKAILFLLAFLIIVPSSSNGQVGGLLKNKLNKVVKAGTKTADKEIDNQIDTAVQRKADSAKEKAAERTENNKKNNGQPAQGGDTETSGQGNANNGGQAIGKLFGNKIDLKYNENYSFTSRIYMITETYDKKDVVKMDFFMYYSSTTPTVGIETKSISTESKDATPVTAEMVMDGENKSFIMLTDMNGMKMGIISEIPDENSDPTQPDGKATKKPQPPTYTKTGNTREIAGYKCDEYAFVDTEDESTGKVWFTRDTDLKIDKRGWKNSGMGTYYGNPDFNDGIILATEAYDEKGKLTSKTETKEVNPDFPHSISIKGYTLRQMNIGKNKK